MKTFRIKDEGRTLIYRPLKRITTSDRSGTLVAYIKNGKKFIYTIALFAGIIALTGLGAGCKSPKLEAGGSYARTNELGQVISYDKALALADATYKFAYETTLDVFRLERDNRAAVWAISPHIKFKLDEWRPKVLEIDRKWAAARKLYKANPTPAGLSAIQTIIAEMIRILPVVQAQLPQIYAAVTTPQQ